MTIASEIPGDAGAQVWRTWARAAAWLSAACFGLGWVVFFGVEAPFGILCWVAGAQAASGVAAVICGLVARRRSGMGGSLGAILTGVVFGLLGIAGIWLFWLLGGLGELSNGGGGFSFGAWGRPLRVRGRIVHPRTLAADNWARGDAPACDGLDALTRRTLARWWLADARKEHASVPAFARLAWQLVALGAPADLVERAYVAGAQEIEHARRCFALVTAYAGEPCGVMPMPELHGDAIGTDLVRLATESLVDGGFIEDLNSDAAELALTRATDPVVRDLLATIVRDERAHAQLAWDLVAWCLTEGGASVAAALRAAAAALPAEGGGLYDDELAALVARCDVADLHAHGRVPLADWPPLYRDRLAATRARLGDLLAGPAQDLAA